MKKLIFRNVELNGNCYDTIILTKRFYFQDVRIMILATYSESRELMFREEIKVFSNFSNTIFQIGDVVELICCDEIGIDNVSLGTGIVQAIEKDSIRISPKEITIGRGAFTNHLLDIFSLLHPKLELDESLANYQSTLLKYQEKISKYQEEERQKEIYSSDLFYYYYQFLFQLIKDNPNYYPVLKLSALSSYLIAKKYFESQKKKVSLPNVFIRGFDVEFDMLLLKSNADHTQLIFDIEDVESIVELKASGIVGYGVNDQLLDNGDSHSNHYHQKRWFESYITFDDSYRELKERFDQYSHSFQNSKYIEDREFISKNRNSIKSKIQDIPFIYCTFFERNQGKGLAYENTYFDILHIQSIYHKNYLGLYFAIVEDRYHYIIPIDYSIKL